VWLVDLEGEAVEVYRGPSSTGYTEVQRLERGQTLAPVAVPDLIPAVDESLEAAPTGNAGTEP
jgi:Uma2 family endonuclease